MKIHFLIVFLCSPGIHIAPKHIIGTSVKFKNIIEKKEIDQGMSLIMIVFTNQEDVSDEQAEQYVK